MPLKYYFKILRCIKLAANDKNNSIWQFSQEQAVNWGKSRESFPEMAFEVLLIFLLCFNAQKAL
ncbi:hypothetical protein T01_7206, partial [Trichinella spiralis]